ncbi:hypothetical protein LTR95_015075 [Oleoguttula sp. CCFEE 5521]
MFSRHVGDTTCLLRQIQSRTFASSACVHFPRAKTTTATGIEGLARAVRKRAEPRKATKSKKKDDEEKPLLGLFAKQARLEQSLKQSIAIRKGKEAGAAARAAGETPSKRSKKASVNTEEPDLYAFGSPNHHDLETFLDFAKKANLSTITSVYKGTLYEYTVASALKAFGFSLRRTGRSNDLGIDLLGMWHLPDESTILKVLVQCKASKPTPAMARELEGAYLGAPSAWQGDHVMGLLVSTHPCTKGVSEAVQRSKSPIGVMQVDRDGRIRQFLWNAVAGERGLTGLGATTMYPSAGREERRENGVATIALTWLGKYWRLPSAKYMQPLRDATSGKNETVTTVQEQAAETQQVPPEQPVLGNALPSQQPV